MPHHHGVGWARRLEPGLSSLLWHLQKGKAIGLTREELQPIVELGEKTATVSLCPTTLRAQFPNLSREQAEEVSRLALELQVHSCSQSCQKRIPFEGQLCSMFFPKMPTLIGLVATTPLLKSEQDELRLETITSFHNKVQEQIRTEAKDPNGVLSGGACTIALLCSLVRKVTKPPVPDGEGGFFFAGVLVPRGTETFGLRRDLAKLGVQLGEDLDLLVCYHYSLLTRKHNKYLPTRTVREAFAVSFNPFILLTSKANGECELITHTPSSVFRYINKGAQSSILSANAKELRNRRNSKREEDMAKSLEQCVERGMRIVTLGEAYRLLDPRMTISSSNGSSVVFISCSIVTNPTPARVLKSQDQAKVRDYMRRWI